MSEHQKMINFINATKCFDSYNGIVLTKLKENYAECKTDLTSDSLNSAGGVAGGLVFSICDFIASYAVFAASAYGEVPCDDKPIVTQSANISFLRAPTTGGSLRGVGVPVKIGRTIAVVEATVYDERDRLIAKGSFTFVFTE